MKYPSVSFLIYKIRTPHSKLFCAVVPAFVVFAAVLVVMVVGFIFLRIGMSSRSSTPPIYCNNQAIRSNAIFN